MPEIGGYIELDTYRLPMLHKDAIALNCGRNALAYLLRARNIKRLWIPKFICDSVTGVCEREGVPYTLYSIDMDFRPSESISLGEGEWLYFVNYYSQFSNEEIAEFVRQYECVIVDNAQSYFQPPLPGVDTLYTCRKYFGVADGAFLYTDNPLPDEFSIDESFNRMEFLLGRYERTANEFYSGYNVNNKFFIDQPIKQMSKLTRNLLHGINYEFVAKQRLENYKYLDERLCAINQLKLKVGSFMYPLMVENGAEIRKKLQKEKIYIPILWPAVFEVAGENDLEYKMAENILPLPIDQRYGIDEMKLMVEEIKRATSE